MKKWKYFLPLLSGCMGCTVTAQFYVEKAWDVGAGFTPTNPDMKTRAQIEVKLYDPDQAKKPPGPSK